MKRLILILLLVPSFAFGESVKLGHYVGISVPSKSVAVARENAIYDISKQLLRTIGAEYTYRFDSTMRSDGKHYTKHQISERFISEAKGFLSQVERNIVESNCTKTRDGYVCRIMVKFSDSQIHRMRRLSKGPKVLIRKVGKNRYEFREINNVGVVLTSAKIVISETNRHAKFLNYYVIKTPHGNNMSMENALPRPIELIGKRSTVEELIVPTKEFMLKDLLYGTKRDVKITLLGTDEVGRDYYVQLP